MANAWASSDQHNQKSSELKFGEEIEITEAGFSFRPIDGFELERDGTVYLYSEGGNLEIYLVGGSLEENQSIADLNDDLAAEFMENVGEYDLIEAGKDLVQGITGFLNEIRFSNAEEEGLGCCLICSPFLNQYFFMLVIANSDYWQSEGPGLWKALKANIHFLSHNQPEIIERANKTHSDLTVEVHQDIAPGEYFFLTVKRGDISLLLAARSYGMADKVSIVEITAPGGDVLYQANPQTGEFFSTVGDQPIIGTHGEVCFVYPRANEQALQTGEYRFLFTTASGEGLQEIQFIIRSGRALGRQKFDLNFWLALKNDPLFDQSTLELFTNDLRKALSTRLAPFNFTPGVINFFQPAPDELESFSVVDLDSDVADCSYMIAESVTNGRALNIGLVDEICGGGTPSSATAGAISSGSPGMILSPGSPHACLLIHWPTFRDETYALAEAIIQQMIVFSGIDLNQTGQPANEDKPVLNREIAWRLRRHPLFYDAA